MRSGREGVVGVRVEGECDGEDCTRQEEFHSETQQNSTQSSLNGATELFAGMQLTSSGHPNMEKGKMAEENHVSSTSSSAWRGNGQQGLPPKYPFKHYACTYVWAM